MTIVLGDLLRITDAQTYLGEEVLNIYYYRSVSITPIGNEGYGTILDWFETEILEPVTQIQVSALVHNQLTIVNMTNGIDFLERAIDVPGEIAADESECLPSYVATGFRLIRESLVTRNGAKRYAGLSEQYTTGNEVLWTGAAQTDIEDALAADVYLGAVLSAEPVIVKHPVGAPPVVSYLYSSVGDAQMRRTVSTQNTRKPRT